MTTQKVPPLRVEALGEEEENARVDLATIADGKAPEKLLGSCCYRLLEDGKGPGVADFDLVEAERNARRLAAAWNFTRAVPLELLEQWVEVGKVLGDNGETGQA